MYIKIIAELGINHNGDINIAKELIKSVKEAGVDLVKFQKRTIEKVYSKDILDQKRESPWGTTQREQKNGLEFSLDDYKIIDSYCRDIGIQWFASSWDLESLEFLDQFSLNYNKIASPMIVDKNFITEVAKRNKHTFISTGMSTEEDIQNAVEVFKVQGTSFELMHCVSTYPMKKEHANLRTIEALKEKFKCDVGYSGHESGVAISVLAAAFKISSLERHVTLDRSMYGSDQAASLEIRGLRELVGSIRTAQICLGEPKIGHILDEEIEIAKKLRSHIKN